VNQEAIALGIVGITFGILGYRFFRSHLASPLSEYLLKQGHVKWAMRMRKWVKRKSGCSSC
jgi:hypothetical protein